jgi:hypothetical protein
MMLATECRYCYGLGHTVSRCPILEETNRREAKEAKQISMAEKRSLGPVKKVADVKVKQFAANPFAALNSGSDDEMPAKKEKKVKKIDKEFPQMAPQVLIAKVTEKVTKFDQEFPQMAQKVVTEKVVPAFSYANAVATKTEIVAPKPSISVSMTVMDAAWEKATSKATTTKSRSFWADAESDDEDEDETRQRQEKSDAAFAYHHAHVAQWEEEDNSAW